MPSVKNPKLRDMMRIFGMFNEEKDKNLHIVLSSSFLKTKKKKRCREEMEMQWLRFCGF